MKRGTKRGKGEKYVLINVHVNNLRNEKQELTLHTSLYPEWLRFYTINWGDYKMNVRRKNYIYFTIIIIIIIIIIVIDSRLLSIDLSSYGCMQVLAKHKRS